MNEIKDKVIIITGATRGFGKSLASALLAKGNIVVAVGRDADERVDAGYWEIKADVTSEAEVQKVAREVIAEFGRMDIWINNAGIWMPRTPVEAIDAKRAHELIEVNFFGLVYGSKAALIQMRAQGFGTIINILSTSSLQGRPNSSIYCASKFAADGFTKSLREEVKGSEIKVMSVYPGGMKTALFDEERPDDFENFLEPEVVVEKIISNFESENPEEEQVIKRPGQQ